jgi:hypothetical protein
MKFEFYFCGVGIEVERHCMRGIRNGGARGWSLSWIFNTFFLAMEKNIRDNYYERYVL